MGLKFKWQRNANISYPKVWLTFQANDIDSDNIVEYRICDLTTDRFEETFQLMVNDYLKHEPINAHLGDKLHIIFNELLKTYTINSIFRLWIR